MKKIFFGKNYNKNAVPFWQPWGPLGFLGRTLGFLFLVASLLFLLSLFRGCGAGNGNATGGSGSAARDWNKPIVGGEEVGLPSPEENNLPPFEEMEPQPNPENDGATEIYSNLLYVIFNSEANDDVFLKFAEKFSSIYPEPDHKISYYNTGAKTAALTVPETTRTQICSELPGKISDVEFLVVPVEVMTQYKVVPNDPAFSDANKSWYFEPIQAYDAWEITMGSSEIIVGIVDSYMDLEHPELKGDRCIHPYSVANGDENVAPPPGTPEDYAGHGTLVAAVAVGSGNNGQGSSGIAPKCKFIPVSMGTSINTITMVEGLLYCMYHGASVINLSCGACFTEEILTMPIDQQIEFSKTYGAPQAAMWDYVFKLAERRNATIVWAAGNENCYGAMDTSKRNASTIRVAAVDHNLKRASFSNYGNFSAKGIHESTISAPGVDIWGALPNNSYAAWPGTSFSSPIIAGVVALIKSENKDLSSAQIIKILQATGKPVSGSPEIGNLVQIKDALVKARETVAAAMASIDVESADAEK